MAEANKTSLNADQAADGAAREEKMIAEGAPVSPQTDPEAKATQQDDREEESSN